MCRDGKALPPYDREPCAAAISALFSALTCRAFASACRLFSAVSGLTDRRRVLGFRRTVLTDRLLANARSAFRAKVANPRGATAVVAFVDALSTRAFSRLFSAMSRVTSAFSSATASVLLARLTARFVDFFLVIHSSFKSYHQLLTLAAEN
jgi:hypothetical protein